MENDKIVKATKELGFNVRVIFKEEPVKLDIYDESVDKSDNLLGQVVNISYINTQTREVITMLVQILASNQFIVNISSKNIKCIIKDGYAAIFETNFTGDESSFLLWYIEDVNTLAQAIEVIYEEYASGNLYKKLKDIYQTDVI